MAGNQAVKELPIAPLSLDLDNGWSYLKTHGDPDWETAESYLPLLVPRILEFLDERDLRITFFVVGRDIEQEPELISQIADAGHEIANHSYLHHPWLQHMDRSELEAEIVKAHDLIEQCTGTPPTGFRGPGYSLSMPTLQVLTEIGYRYDSTVFPNVLNPLARKYFLRSSKLSEEEIALRDGLFGSFSDAFQPIRPFGWRLSSGDEITEIPVTTMPLLRMPFHFSYQLYLAAKSHTAAMTYLHTALWLCDRARISPSLLMHPLDFLGRKEYPHLEFFPGMDLSRDEKLRYLAKSIDTLANRYELTKVDSYLDVVSPLKKRKISRSVAG